MTKKTNKNFLVLFFKKERLPLARHKSAAHQFVAS